MDQRDVHIKIWDIMDEMSDRQLALLAHYYNGRFCNLLTKVDLDHIRAMMERDQ